MNLLFLHLEHRHPYGLLPGFCSNTPSLEKPSWTALSLCAVSLLHLPQSTHCSPTLC